MDPLSRRHTHTQHLYTLLLNRGDLYFRDGGDMSRCWDLPHLRGQTTQLTHFQLAAVMWRPCATVNGEIMEKMRKEDAQVSDICREYMYTL